ncbi:helix-turn-helix domain-containing protein [Sulfitobacter pontiacus]|uniref:helix-turn-helix domain-containing protein n=1 Tax=Sulfitobacter pontiacus TaxID=60137 RepID=UPI0015DDBBD7|nr:helix-turn-helix domain-containing protein [Sulfitobacter pontiacus]QLL44332.1 replication protein C [Sulfitobacter pontiacus]
MKHQNKARTALAERTDLPYPNPYELLGPVRILRKQLGLTTNDLAVLTALISFLPRERREGLDNRQIALTVVFPSNASLSERANGLDERTLRRSLGRLSAADLIERKSSANGKRFPLRYGGVIKDAFGIDLKPLIQRYDTLSMQASQITEELEHLRSLKTEALALRASLLRQTGLDEGKLSTLHMFRNILRRATLTVDAVLSIISELRDMGAATDACYGERHTVANSNAKDSLQAVEQRSGTPNPVELTASNGQNVRHIESTTKDINKIAIKTTEQDEQTSQTQAKMNRNPEKMAWEDFTHVAGLFPVPPHSGETLNRILYDLGKLLRVGQDRLKRGIQMAGAGKLLLVFDYLLARSGTIKHPDAYFEKVLCAQLDPILVS